MSGRAVPEWIGRTPESRPPPRVRRRIFDRHNGICHISKRAIRPGDEWHCDHIVALINGGENREGNLAPALKYPHREKTARDVAEKAKIERIRKRHLGIKRPRTMTAWRNFKREVVRAPRER